jgi:hypothetical protein
MTRFLPHWRKATWALLIFTVLAGVWILANIGRGDGVAPIVLSLIGVAVLGPIWFLGRSNLNTAIVGPQGQRWIVSAKTAERRSRSGWSYAPTAA